MFFIFLEVIVFHHFTHFLKKSMPVIQVLRTKFVYHSFFLVKPSSAHHNRPSLKQPLYLNIRRSFMHTSHFITQNIQKVYTQLSRFNEINFYCIMKNTPKRNNERKQCPLVQVGAIILT